MCECVCVCVCLYDHERERERGRERKTTEKEKERKTERGGKQYFCDKAESGEFSVGYFRARRNDTCHPADFLYCANSLDPRFV